MTLSQDRVEILATASSLRPVQLEDSDKLTPLIKDPTVMPRSDDSLGELQSTPSSLEQEVTRQLGFAGVFHELELYGICPECQQSHHHTTPPTKLASMIQRG